MNVVDEPKTVFQSFYKHLDEIERETESQARYVGTALSSLCCLLRGCSTGDERYAVSNAACNLIQRVWRHRVQMGLADGDRFIQFWDLVTLKYRPNVDFLRVSRSEARVRAVKIELQPRNTTERIAITVDP